MVKYFYSISLRKDVISIVAFLEYISQNSIVLALSSLCGIAGFCLTIIVTLHTNGLKKRLRRMEYSSSYNKKRKEFYSKFNAHRESIDSYQITSKSLVNDILTEVTSCIKQCSLFFSLREKLVLYKFKRYLKKDYSKINFDCISKYLSEVSGILSEKEISK